MKPRSSDKRYPVKIRGLIGELMQRWTLQAQQQGQLLGKAWLAAVGEKVAAHSQPVRLSGSRLIVAVESAAWMNELTYLKESIKIRAKKSFSEQGITVEDIIFKLGLVKKTLESRTDVPPPGK